jgi:hypothetical protein
MASQFDFSNFQFVQAVKNRDFSICTSQEQGLSKHCLSGNPCLGMKWVDISAR